MAVAQKYHIGKNGPMPCGAKQRPCKYASTDGAQEEVEALWAKQMAEEHGDSLFEGARRDQAPEPGMSDGERSVRETLSQRSSYQPGELSNIGYEGDEQGIAMKLALSNLSELSYAEVSAEDTDWESKGISVVERYKLKGGAVGYFKSFQKNSYSESTFLDYGTSSLGASINEVNSYRLGKLLGDGYEDLVPETVIREINGKLGTLQREVREDRRLSRDLWPNSVLKEDYRRAAIFDFVSGNLDRHHENFIYGVEESKESRRNRIRLIDNSFSFPKRGDKRHFNQSIFADNERPGGWLDSTGYTMSDYSLRLQPEDERALERARSGIAQWKEDGTMEESRASAAMDRIDFLLREKKLSSFGEYYYQSGQPEEE